jgi:hypothetical protein
VQQSQDAPESGVTDTPLLAGFHGLLAHGRGRRACLAQLPSFDFFLQSKKFAQRGFMPKACSEARRPLTSFMDNRAVG